MIAWTWLTISYDVYEKSNTIHRKYSTFGRKEAQLVLDVHDCLPHTSGTGSRSGM